MVRAMGSGEYVGACLPDEDGFTGSGVYGSGAMPPLADGVVVLRGGLGMSVLERNGSYVARNGIEDANGWVVLESEGEVGEAEAVDGGGDGKALSKAVFGDAEEVE